MPIKKASIGSAHFEAQRALDDHNAPYGHDYDDKRKHRVKADNTAVKRKAKVTQDPYKGGLNEGGYLPAGMRTDKFDREQYSRERGEAQTRDYDLTADVEPKRKKKR
jgi:hypothetical protein